jgi:hypothetical protein
METRTPLLLPQKSLIFLFTALTAFTLLGAAPSKAGWFDSFANGMVSHSSSAWTMQQQNHFAGGGFSMRFENRNKKLFGITAPRVSIGCGGIDAFWGGFSFLDPEYLIQMMRNILQAAPAFAFKLALQALCEPCAAALQELMAIAEALNALAVDECGISNAIAGAGAAAISNIFGFGAEQGEKKGSGPDWLESLKSFRGDVQNFVLKLNDMMKFKFCGHLGGAAKDNCVKIYASEGTLWERARELDAWTSKGDDALDSDNIALFRGLLGDIEFTPAGQVKDEDGNSASSPEEPSQARITYLQSDCAGQTIVADVINLMVDTQGNAPTSTVPMWPLDAGKGCVLMPVPESLKLGVKANTALDDINSKMQTSRSSPLASATIDLIERNTLPVYKMMNLYSLRTRLRGGEFMTPDEKNRMAKLMAVGHAAYLFEHGLAKAHQIVSSAYTEIAPAVQMVQGTSDAFAKAKEAFDLRVTTVQGQIHHHESTHLQIYYKSIQDSVDVINLQRDLEQKIFSRAFANR